MADVDPLFQFHRLNEQGIKKAQEIAERFNGLLVELNRLIPVQGRELAIAKTKLEEAAFFAKKAMAQDSTNQH